VSTENTTRCVSVEDRELLDKCSGGSMDDPQASSARQEIEKCPGRLPPGMPSERAPGQIPSTSPGMPSERAPGQIPSTSPGMPSEV